MKIIPGYYKSGSLVCCRWEFQGYDNLLHGEGASCKEAFLDLIRTYKSPEIMFSNEQLEWLKELK